MQRAKSLGIDAFALNIGVDFYTDTQLGYAYQSAANNGMKVFISFDFNVCKFSELCFSFSDTSRIFIPPSSVSGVLSPSKRVLKLAKSLDIS
jgi:hypothetical protein